MGQRPEVARGFTLLELIVTLAVLALAAAVVTPAIGRGTEALKARAEVAGFAATLRHARERAINVQRTHRVVVDSKDHRVAIIAAAAPGEEKEFRETRALPPKLTIEPAQGSGEVTFDPRGLASAASFKLTSGGIVYSVKVDPLTGRVRSTRE
jgi:general secretion pathway protein H